MEPNLKNIFAPFLSLLSLPAYYRFFQFLFYKPRVRQWYADHWIQANRGAKVLDIGCGPGTILNHLSSVDYTGFDANSRYLDWARTHFKDGPRFLLGSVEEPPDLQAEKFDIVMANGILHHLSDETARKLLEYARGKLVHGGYFVSLDGCLLPKQNWISRKLLEWDRGEFVRHQGEYEALIKPFFPGFYSEVKSDLVRVPYDILLVRAGLESVQAGG